MKFKSKIRYLLDLKGFSMADYAVRTNRTKQAVSKRISDGALNMREIVDICDMTGYKLAVLDENDEMVLTFSKQDWEKD